MLPLVGFSRATTRRKRVVLPAPEPPTMQVVSPCRHTRSMPRRTSVSPKALRTPLRTTISRRLVVDAEASPLDDAEASLVESRFDDAEASAGPLGMNVDRAYTAQGGAGSTGALVRGSNP